MRHPLLRLTKVSRRFGGLVAVDAVDLDVSKETITGLIGPNGAGKSTLFHVISGVLSPTEGEMFFDQTPIHGREPHEIAALGMSRTFQNIQIVKEMSVLENTLIGCHLQGSAGFLKTAFPTRGVREEERRLIRSALEALSFVGLEQDAHKPAHLLPLGQLRLLELARALASRPKLLLLDEIAAGLNHTETKRMGALIRKIREQGVTVLLVEHDMDLVMSICDRVVVLNQGQKIAEGTPEEVRTDENVIRAYLGEETEVTG
ncbi:ABC transporter ATP-binding protein [Staphylospora marina]|uniref:ABC transporter ATP-binding protein n=1 Tax=Staphylospora marina TaxID=2490858 RepID=UPI000F5B9118|nr:ABC transporter ATP-binding protein [Staphylospora marina]